MYIRVCDVLGVDLTPNQALTFQPQTPNLVFRWRISSILTLEITEIDREDLEEWKLFCNFAVRKVPIVGA